MYKFSLDYYTELFENSIKKSNTAEQLNERIENLNKHHTYAVYENICRGLLEHHRLLFSFQICTKILTMENKINEDELEFFLNGGTKPNDCKTQLIVTKCPGTWCITFYRYTNDCCAEMIFIFFFHSSRLVTGNTLAQHFGVV